MLGRTSAVIFALVMMAALGAGCASDKQVISQATKTHKGLEPAVVTDPELVAYISQIGDRIVAVAREEDRAGRGPKAHKDGEDPGWMFEGMKFHFVNSKTLNAFTTGGKHMYIYNELFQSCKNEDELAAVMAHEYAHVYCRHVSQGMNRQYATLALAAGAGVAGYALADDDNRLGTAGVAAGAAFIGGQFIGMGFTRDDEDEADKIGFAFYARAGWDPNRFAGFFQTLIDKGLDNTPEAMSDHPKLSNRVAAAKRRTSQLPATASQWRKPPIADEARFRQLQARAVQVGRTMPNDKTLAQAQLLLAAFPSCVSPTEQPDQKQAQRSIIRAQQGSK